MKKIEKNLEGERDIKALKSLHNVCWKLYKDLKLITYKDSDTRQAFFQKVCIVLEVAILIINIFIVN